MKIKYANIKSDYVKFNEYHMKNSAAVKTANLIVHGIALFVAVLIVVREYTSTNSVFAVLNIFMGYIVFVFVHKFLRRKTINWLASTMISEGKSPAFICDHEIEINETGIEEITPVGSTFAIFESIIRIAENDEYFFIYLSAVSAHIIPKNRTEGDVEKFIAKLKSINS